MKIKADIGTDKGKYFWKEDGESGFTAESQNAFRCANLLFAIIVIYWIKIFAWPEATNFQVVK